ncbi:MAG: hypothetical protein K9M08_21935 [Pirellula sp.]|nr:hypothetical protein [Pirellula sp.]
MENSQDGISLEYYHLCLASAWLRHFFHRAQSHWLLTQQLIPRDRYPEQNL